MTEFSGELEGVRRLVHEATDLPSFEELMQRATRDIDRVGASRDRWRLLVGAIVTFTPDQALDDLLVALVEFAVDLVDAAVGVLEPDAPDGSGEHRSIVVYGRSTDGWTGDGPAARNRAMQVLGLPPSSVESNDTLHATVRVGSRIFGSLHLVGDGTRQFDDEDRQLTTALLAIASVAIENARLREAVERRERSLLGAMVLLQPPVRSDDVAGFVADRIRALAGADVAWVVGGPCVDDLYVEAVSGGPVPAGAAELDFTRSLERCAIASGRSLRVKDVSTHPRAVDISTALGTPALGVTLLLPLAEARGEAVVAVGWRRQAEGAAVAWDPGFLDLLGQQAALILRAARERSSLALAQDEREQVARDLHDLVIQRLFAMGLDLKSTSWLHDPQEIAAHLDRAVSEVDVTIRDIRRTIFGLESARDAADPVTAMLEVVERAGRTLKVQPTVRFSGPVSALDDPGLVLDAVAVLSEGLSNCARHARASTCTVEVEVADAHVTICLEDDGVGLPEDMVESGLANIRIRAERRGGSLSVSSAHGRGTRLVWQVPLAG